MIHIVKFILNSVAILVLVMLSSISVMMILSFNSPLIQVITFIASVIILTFIAYKWAGFMNKKFNHRQ